MSFKMTLLIIISVCIAFLSGIEIQKFCNKIETEIILENYKSTMDYTISEIVNNLFFPKNINEDEINKQFDTLYFNAIGKTYTEIYGKKYTDK